MDSDREPPSLRMKPVGGVKGHILSWKRCILLTLLLLPLSFTEAAASCRILRCNSDFVAATLDLGGGVGVGGGGAVGGMGGGGGAPISRAAMNAGYCSALRSYATCTRRMARACRGDLAYHSAVQGIEDLLIQHRCPRVGPTPQPRPLPQGTLSADDCIYERGFLSREGRTPEYVHCGVFGDPHVRTFDDNFQTCAVQGAWPLIDNEFLYVQATSSPTGGSDHKVPTTTLTKISVIFKNVPQCVEQKLYQAELDNVPAAFADGSVSSGDRLGYHSLKVQTQNPGGHAEIHAAHIGTLLVVRQSGRSLGLSVLLPRGVAEAYGPEQDLQLCVWGCPASQRLDTLRPPLPHASLPRTISAHAHCAALLPNRDVYYQACVFDLISSGDLNSSTAAIDALTDAGHMIPERERVHLLPLSAAAGKVYLNLILMLLLMLLLMLGMLGTLS